MLAAPTPTENNTIWIAAVALLDNMLHALSTTYFHVGVPRYDKGLGHLAMSSSTRSLRGGPTDAAFRRHHCHI
jgi:hypothetical protein